MAKFKVGDRVKVVKKDIYTNGPCSWVLEMDKFEGVTTKVDDIDMADNTYKLKDTERFYFREEWLESVWEIGNGIDYYTDTMTFTGGEGGVTITQDNVLDIFDRTYKELSGDTTIKKITKKTMNAISKLFLSADTKALIEAGYLDSELELTMSGRQELDAIVLEAHQEALVAKAKAKIAEAKKTK